MLHYPWVPPAPVPYAPTPMLRQRASRIRRGRATLDALAAKAGRDPRSIEVLAYGAPGEPEALKAFEEAGADAVSIRFGSLAEKESLAELEGVARKVIT